MKRIALIASFFLLLQACVEIPVKQDKKSEHTIKLPYAASTEAIKNKNENKYAQKLQALRKRKPILEAQQEILTGNRFFLEFQSGRGEMRSVPGLTLEQTVNTSCGFKRLDGFGDMLYGRNHLKYQIELKEFAEKFNLTMFLSCR